MLVPNPPVYRRTRGIGGAHSCTVIEERGIKMSVLPKRGSCADSPPFSRDYRGTSATARTGEPDPPFIFNGNAIKNANGGNLSRFFKFSTT